MEQRIIEFRPDGAMRWLAQLSCTHVKPMQAYPGHAPPWLLTPEGRHAHIGQLIPCGHCGQR